MNLINKIIDKEIKLINKIKLEFKTGDIITVHFNNKNLKKKNYQTFTGIVISKKDRKLNSSFIVRRIKNNIGVEKTFQSYSPFLLKIDIKIKNKYKKSKLYTLRKKN